MSPVCCRDQAARRNGHLFGAPLDHLGIGLPDANGDAIYNGALDNATGVAHIIEQARAFAKAPRTERSVVFLAVAAEEKGLLGSAYYAANPIYPLGKTVAVINTDGLGVFGRTRDFSISGSAKLGLLDLLTAEAASRPPLSRPIRAPKRAASTARTISPSPRAACRRFPSIPATIWSRRHRPRRGAGKADIRQALPSARRRMFGRLGFDRPGR